MLLRKQKPGRSPDNADLAKVSPTSVKTLPKEGWQISHLITKLTCSLQRAASVTSEPRLLSALIARC